MIEVRKHDDGDAQLYVAEEGGTGRFIGINLDDHQGLKLWLDLASFYQIKGHDMAVLLAATPTAKPGFIQRVKDALAYVMMGR